MIPFYWTRNMGQYDKNEWLQDVMSPLWLAMMNILCDILCEDLDFKEWLHICAKNTNMGQAKFLVTYTVLSPHMAQKKKESGHP